MTNWVASRLAAAQLALVSIEGVTEHAFTIRLRGWKMTINIKAPWYVAWWTCWRARRATLKALSSINVPIEVKTTWEHPQ